MLKLQSFIVLNSRYINNNRLVCKYQLFYTIIAVGGSPSGKENTYSKREKAGNTWTVQTD
jgi:hypothetical protein